MASRAQKKNSYEDADMENVLKVIEDFEAQQQEIRSSAGGKCAKLGQKIEDEIATAGNLGIPKRLLNTVRKQRKLERQLSALAAGIPEDMMELYEDASGQFSFLKPTKEEQKEQKIVSPATLAAARARKAAQKNQAAEQAEGGKILDDMTTH